MIALFESSVVFSEFLMVLRYFVQALHGLQCFDAVGWAALVG